MKQAKWLELWREVTGDERITQVDVRRLKNSADKGAAEVAAYTAKDSEYMLSQEVFDVFYNACEGGKFWPTTAFSPQEISFSRPNSLTNSEKRTPLSTFGFSCIAGALVNTSKPKTRAYPEEQERLAGQMIEEVDDDEQ